MKLDANLAKSADNLSTGIESAGKYIGVITRAERIVTDKGTIGLGISFRSNDGQTADRLDLYTQRANGEDLPSMKHAQAIMACLKLREAPIGMVTFEKWDSTSKQRVSQQGEGYPSIQGKQIGFVIRMELSDYEKNGEVKESVKPTIYGVFDPTTEFMASEILAADPKPTKPEKLAKFVEYVSAHPVYDARRNKSKAPAKSSSQSSHFVHDFDDDIPF